MEVGAGRREPRNAVMADRSNANDNRQRTTLIVAAKLSTSPVFSANRAAMRLKVTLQERPIPPAVLKTSGTNVAPSTSLTRCS